jgi:hypothetical protein
MGLTKRQLLSLTMPALVGGYCFATAFGIFLGGVLPIARGEAVLIGNLFSFIAYIGAIMWVFGLRNPTRAWLILLPSATTLASVGLYAGGAL